MEIKFLNQPKDVKFIDILSNKLKNKHFTKVWIIAGFAKDSAMDCILNDIEVARNNGVTIECIFGLDKKNTSKDMLLKLLKLGCNIRFHLNEEGVKLESRLFAFESQDSESFVYITGGKFSEGGISSNLTLIEEICYSKDEKLEFSKVKAAIENGVSNDEFEVLTEDRLKELAATGDILARITERKIPSISELYSNNSEESTTNVQNEYDESISTDYSELLNKEVDIDIDLGDSIKVQSSLGEEVEHKIKKTTSEKKEEESVVSKLILGNEKNSDFDKMSTLIIPTTKPISGGTEIRIPATITSNMLEFLDYPDEFHTYEDEKGNIKEFKKITLEIYENDNNSTVVDEDACLIQTVKFTSIKSDMFKDISIEDGDIIRLIKNGLHDYRCEIIKKSSEEFNIWQEFCNKTVKGSTKKFGIS